MKELDAKELIELLNGWPVNNEQGMTVLYELAHGVALEDIPVNNTNEALAEAFNAVAQLMNQLFTFDYDERAIDLKGIRLDHHTFISLLELRARVLNLIKAQR